MTAPSDSVAAPVALTRELASRLDCIDGCPVLDGGLESSVRGLHFAGAPAVESFGPLLRFVSGTEFASRSLVRAITRKGLARLDAAIADGDLELQRPEQRAG